MENFLKTIFLFAFVTGLVMLAGYTWGGRGGMTFALGLAGLINLVIYGFCDRFVLAMHRAIPLREDEAPEVFDIVRKLSAKARIPVPRLYMLPSAAANAFSTGRGSGHAGIAVTHGLVGLLNKEELAGVLGHEVAHIVNRDILLASLVATLAGALSMIASMFRGSFLWGGERDERDRENPLPILFFAAVMPFVALLIRLAISRSSEYKADELGARLCGEPLYLASALKKIEVFSRRFPLRDAAPATAHLFIANPLSAKGWPRFFNTHPPVEDRVVRLGALPF